MKLLAVAFILFSSVAQAAVYDVGPSQTYASIGATPLASLQPGDTVRIHYRRLRTKRSERGSLVCSVAGFCNGFRL
jgi:hypothetical protein